MRLQEKLLKMTQPVLLQSFNDEFNLPSDEVEPRTPAEPGQVLMPCDVKEALDPKMQMKFQSGVGKLLHMMHWSCPDILNATRELSRHMKRAAKRHMIGMYRVMRYCLATPERGFVLRPKGVRNGDRNYEFEIMGMSDANYATDPST